MLSQIAARNPKASGVIATTNGSHNTITMGNIQPLTSITLSGLNGTSNDWDIFGNKNVKKYEVFETSEDILALSVTWHDCAH